MNVDKLHCLHQTLAPLLGEIEDVAVELGLKVSRATLVLRDEANDDMSVIVTSETEESVEGLIRVVRARMSETPAVTRDAP